MSFAQDLQRASTHDMIECEKVGDTLVITARGDVMQFTPSTFDNELQRARRIASDEAIRNIVCDFSSKSYFSQEMVVPIIGLRDQIRTRGRFVAAGMSEEMSKLFEHSESGTHILQYPTRQAAVSDVAKVSAVDSIKSFARRNRWIARVVFFGVLILAVVGVWEFGLKSLVAGSPARRLYRSLERAWADANEVVHSNPTKANWRGLGDRFQDRVFDQLIAMRSNEDRTDAEEAAMKAAQALQGMSQRPQELVTSGQKRFLELAETARVAIEAEDGVSVPRLEPIALPDAEPSREVSQKPIASGED